MQHDGSGFLGVLTLLFVAAIALLIFVFWVVMLVDAIKNPRLNSTERIVWVLVILFVNWVGALIYYLVGRRR